MPLTRARWTFPDRLAAAFGAAVTVLPNGNFVVTDPNYSIPAGAAFVGAVYLYSPAGTLISTLTGSTANDQVGKGGVTVLANGNYVVVSQEWDNGATTDAGAVTWGSGSTGVSGVVSAANSLVGDTAGDFVGNAGVTALTNGNYVVRSNFWDRGATANVGAVTWGNGSTGVVGVVSEMNSLVGDTAGDVVGGNLGTEGVIVLTNGNYVVLSTSWGGNKGAVTWGNGSTGVSGLVSSTNSLVGATTTHQVGNGGVIALTNGNYVVGSPVWDGAAVNVGAVTWGNGTTGIKGLVSSTNSLVGSTANDLVGTDGVTALTNGNYVVGSPFWDNGMILNAGAATWGNGSTGVAGVVSDMNSLVGSTANDRVSSDKVVALTNGNYVVLSSLWDGVTTNVGAATWGNGTTGITGLVSSTNSLVGGTNGDQVGNGGATALTNGNYVVRSPDWDNGGAANAGAATWGNGSTGVVGQVSVLNSLVGSTTFDFVGTDGVTALANGNYVVRSSMWGSIDVGAVTWGNGASGIAGPVSAANSLVGSMIGDEVGSTGVTALTNGNYVVSSPNWGSGGVTAAGKGAATWGNGSTGVVGPVSVLNSLVGTQDDTVGLLGVTALTNGNYVVNSPSWNSSVARRVGAVTWGNGSTGIVGAVSAANSLVGSTANDGVGRATAFSDGNYVVFSSNVGAVTPSLGSNGIVGPVTAGNSVLDPNLVFGYDSVRHQLVVGRPGSNIVTIFGLNRPPVLSAIGNKTAIGGEPLTFSASATDPDGDTLTYSLVGAPAGATIDAASGVFSWTPTAVGSVSFTVRASDVTSFASETIMVSVTDSISLTSGPTATPSTAGVGQSVAFSISVASSGALTYAWNIAGTVMTEASPAFAFTASGVYTINVTVSTAAGTTVTGSVTVTVVAPVMGTGNDSDGDGFSDDVETAAGTDPNNPADSPTGGGPAPAIADLIQAKLRIKLNFAKPASDSISFSGTLPIAAGFNAANQTATIDVGGAVKTVTLDVKGKSKLFKLGIKSKKGVVAAQTAKYGVKLSKGDFAASLTDEGLTNADATNKAANVAVRIVFGGVIYEHVQAVMYKAKAGKGGAASAAK